MTVTETLGVTRSEKKLQDAPYFRSWPVRIALYGVALGTVFFMFFGDVSAPALGGLAALFMLCLLFMNVHIGVAMGVAGALALFLLRGSGVVEGALRTLPFGTTAVWSYTVLPMFIFMGLLLWRSGITERIYAAATNWLSWMPGGLAVGTNFAGAGMSAITGSTVATVAALGRIGLPEMLKRNYDPRLATGSVIIAGTGGQLIPPSIYMVIYAGIASVPVGPQLMAGLVPGVLLAVLYAFVIIGLVLAMPHLVGRRRGEGFGDTGITWRDRWQSLARVWPLPLLIIVMFGGMYSGFFTTTEAGAFGAFGALLLTFLYLKPRKATHAVGQSLKDTVGSTAGIFFLFFGAMIFNRALVVSGVTGVVTDAIEAMGLNAVGFLLMLILMYLILGMVLDPLTMMLISVPLLMPSLETFGISLVFFGVFVVFLGELAVMTPPVGMMVFILFKLAQLKDVNLGRRVTLGQVFMGAAWFLPISVGLLIFMVFFPEIATWLPSLMAEE
ncbi:TRAP transporter large permease [Leucobacter sp. W1038]|uniref:TRAP transporter large permease n=1 Tax=Leucobacter sp. W1038 TaxID=3438281 RepID=UPI003D964498